MASYNKVILVGNMTRDPQLRYLPNQTAVVDFGLAVNHRYKTAQGEQREDVMFIDCSAFGKPAEIINQYCQKGKPILIEGRLRLETWEDKQGGGKRSKHSVHVDNFQFLGSRGDAGGGAPGSAAGGEEGQQSPPPRQAPRPQQAKPQPQAGGEAPFGDEQQFKEDDIPF